MFHVRHKETGQIKAVYAVLGTLFLLWSEEKGRWYCEDMNHFRPYEVTV